MFESILSMRIEGPVTPHRITGDESLSSTASPESTHVAVTPAIFTYVAVVFDSSHVYVKLSPGLNTPSPLSVETKFPKVEGFVFVSVTEPAQFGASSSLITTSFKSSSPEFVTVI